MSLSLFDLSDYPQNQGSYWEGIMQGSAGEPSNDSPGPGPPWNLSFLFLEESKPVLESVASIHQVLIYYF